MIDRPLKIFAIFTILMALFAYSNSLIAQEQDHKQQAQQVIDACWSENQEDLSSGITSHMRTATINTAQCMKQHLIDLSQSILFKDDAEAQKEVKAALDKIADGTGALYWKLHNENAECKQSPCGTMNQLTHNSKVIEQMKLIMYDFYQKKYEIGL